MPPSFCLLPQYVERLREKVANGELDPAALSGLTSAERRAKFAEIVGDANAGHLNAAFESKLLLKNQQQGLEAWARGLTDVKPEIRRDLLARIERMDRVLSPRDLDSFLADLARQKLGFGVTMEEAGRIAELAKASSEARAAMEAGTGDRMDYGRARVAYGNYVADLKNGAKSRTVGGTIKDVAGFSKSIKASFDNSALLRQGWKNLFAHPEIWYKNAKQSFVDLVHEFGGHEVLDEVHADLVSRPNALNGRYQRAGLALGNVEEAFPTSLPEKIPGVGRAFKASEAAFTGFQYRMRADVFDKYMQIAARSGVDLNDPTQLQSIGNLVNELTSRGNLRGSSGGLADAVNVTFFSPRKLVADFDFLTGHNLEPGTTPFVRKQAAINLLKVASGTAAVLTIANAVAPGSVEWDPRSSDFGKIKIRDTRFDVTGGMGSLITLGARLALQSKKVGKVVQPINAGTFGGATDGSLIMDFLGNKLSPAAAVIRDLRRGYTFDHEPTTAGTTVRDLVAPLPLTNARELLSAPNGADPLLGIIADALGISVNTYAPPKPAKKPHAGRASHTPSH
jgi:hypothetical protein